MGKKAKRSISGVPGLGEDKIRDETSKRVPNAFPPALAAWVAHPHMPKD